MQTLLSISHDIFRKYSDILKMLDIYEQLALPYSEPCWKHDSQSYFACSLSINHHHVKLRVANITPKKLGQFITFYKRDLITNQIIPYDGNDPFDFLIIITRKNEQLGQFIFPKAILVKHNVLSQDNIGGKRALRVYPPWDKTHNKQAIETQKWQIKYFTEINCQPYPKKITRLLQTK